MILNEDETDFVQSALIELSIRRPSATPFCKSAGFKLVISKELTEQDKKVLALAIQGKCMHDGSAAWTAALSIIEKLGLGDLLEEYLKSWTVYPKAIENG